MCSADTRPSSEGGVDLHAQKDEDGQSAVCHVGVTEGQEWARHRRARISRPLGSSCRREVISATLLWKYLPFVFTLAGS